MTFNPAQAYLRTQEKFIHFLLDRTMGDTPRDGEEEYWGAVRAQLAATWKGALGSGASLYAAPVLEGLFPYPSGAESVTQLRNDGVLEPGMENFISPKIVAGEYNLYKHQADSIRVSGVEGKDIIVSSGTGSGKTECFLYSMINNLMRNKVNLEEPGVRILMIYPRNALVKDQLRRILDMVMGKNPRISVGMYIGETETDEESPMSDWETEIQNNVGENIFLRYYKRTRDEIRRNPPTILITNYSMLEWMMLRDKDRTIFAQSRGKLEAVVLDEAHLYSGALGNDINMLIRRTLERFYVSKDTVRFYATSATIGDGHPDTLKKVAAALFGIEENRIMAITGEREWPADGLPVGGNLDEGERQRLADIRHRLVADRECEDAEHGTKPKNFLKLTVSEVELLAKCSSEVTDAAGECYLPYKLHTFMDIPKMVYSDLDTAERPLGNLQLTPVFANGVRGVEVYAITPRISEESGVYFKAYLEEENHPPFTRKFVANTANRQLRPIYFRRRAEPDVAGFDLEISNLGWVVQERGVGEGAFVLAKRNAQGGVWAGAATEDEWFLRDGNTAISTWGDNDSYMGSSLIPLAFVPQDMRLSAYTEMLFPELPPAEVPDGVDAEVFLHERSWQGRQMLVFSDSRARAAMTAPTLQGNHQRELIKNCIYRELTDNGECGFSDLGRLVFDDFGNEFHLSQNLYGIDENAQTDLKRDCLIPSLAYCALAISSDTRSLEEVRAIQRLPVDIPCPNGIERGVLFSRLIVPGVDEPTTQQKEDHWREVVCPALVVVFQSRRAVFFRQAHEQIRKEVGKWSKETRCRHEALGTGLGYVWYDLRERMFLREQDFLSASRGAVYNFIFQHFRLMGGNNDDGLRRALFDYLRNIAGQLPLHLSDEGLSGMPLFVKVNKWHPRLDDDEVQQGNGPGHPGVSLNPYALRFQISENGNEYERNSYFYRHVTDIADGAWGGLSVPEHSAQLETTLLEDVEASFKDHKLNVISCTPTLEVGIDIGALPVITMANLPPDKAGYLQRAGRAGRGPKATAMISTFLSDTIWDKLVKQDSMSFFKRENVFSVAKIEDPSVAGLVKQHVYLFLLGTFFDAMYERELQAAQEAIQANRPENPILAWDRAGSFLANAEHLRYHQLCLQRHLEWLEGQGLQRRARYRKIHDELQKVTGYLDGLNETDCPRYRSMRTTLEGKIADEWFMSAFRRIVSGTVWAQAPEESLRALIRNLDAELTKCSFELNAKLEELQTAREKIDQGEIADENANKLRRLKNLLDVQFSSIYGEYLISYLTHNRVIPAYGFPVDVVSLVSGENEIQRLKLLAIREFTPGNRIPMGHTFTSVDALSPNYGADDDSRYKLWYLPGRCPHCGEITPPQEIGVGEVHCPYCGRDFEPVNRVRCVEPTGYRSLSDPVNASLARKRMSYVSPEMYLELHALSGFGVPANGVSAVVSASFHYCSSENPEEMPVLKCVNEGASGNGFVVHRETGRVMPDVPSGCWTPGVELTEEERRSKAKVVKWQRDIVQDQLDAHYLHNVQLLCWTQVPALVCSITETAGGLLLGRGDDSVALRSLVSMALQRHASEVLKLDSRALMCEVKVLATKNACHFALYSTDGDADCYFGEIENLIRAQIGADGVNGFFRDALLRIRPTAAESQDALLTYSNTRDFASITDPQFAAAFQWVQNNLQQLICHQPEVVNGLQLTNPVDLFTNITMGTSAITLLYPNLTVTDLEQDSVILDLLGRTSDACEINVCFDRLNGGTEQLEYAALSRMWALTQAHGRLKFRRVPEELRNDFSSVYGSGARMGVGGHWIYLRLSLFDDAVDLTRKSWMEFLTPMVRKSCWKTSGHEQLLSDVLATETISEPQMPVNYEPLTPVYTRFGLPYVQLTAKDILNALHIDPAVMQVRKVHYEDRYFMTPKSWIFFYWMMKEFHFENDASIEIVAMPLADKPGHPILDLHGFGLDQFRLRSTSSKVAGYAIANEDVDLFRDYVANKLCIDSVRFLCQMEHNPQNVQHGRELQITYADENGELKKVTILLDSGMDMLNFNFNGYTPMFSENAKQLAYYNQRYYIIRGASVNVIE